MIAALHDASTTGALTAAVAFLVALVLLAVAAGVAATRKRGAEPPMGRYRLRSWMVPMHGQPVNWNARAIIWSGADRRYYVREAIRRLRTALRRNHFRQTDPLYRLSMWLWDLTDDRDRTYRRPGVVRLRRWLNTQADVEARKAWAQTNRYWRASATRKKA